MTEIVYYTDGTIAINGDIHNTTVTLNNVIVGKTVGFSNMFHQNNCSFVFIECVIEERFLYIFKDHMRKFTERFVFKDCIHAYMAPK